MTPLPSDTAAKADRLLAVLRRAPRGRGRLQRRDRQHRRCQGGLFGARRPGRRRHRRQPQLCREVELADARRLAALIGIRHEVVATARVRQPGLPAQRRHAAATTARASYTPQSSDLLPRARGRRRLQRGQPRRPGRLPPGPDGRRRARLSGTRCRRPGSPRPMSEPWPRPGACRPGTSRPPRACRAGWRRAGRHARADGPASRPPRRSCGARACASAGCACTRGTRPHRSTGRARWPDWPHPRSATSWPGGSARLGFKFVTLDLEGFRTGSLNDLVGLDVRARYQEAAGRVPGGVP